MVVTLIKQRNVNDITSLSQRVAHPNTQGRYSRGSGGGGVYYQPYTNRYTTITHTHTHTLPSPPYAHRYTTITHTHYHHTHTHAIAITHTRTTIHYRHTHTLPSPIYLPIHYHNHTTITHTYTATTFQQLYPRRKQLLTKFSHRCRQCNKYAIKPSIHPRYISFEVGSVQGR